MSLILGSAPAGPATTTFLHKQSLSYEKHHFDLPVFLTIQLTSLVIIDTRCQPDGPPRWRQAASEREIARAIRLAALS